MSFFLKFFATCLALSSCASLPPGYKLSKFSYNGGYHNNLIVSRVPDYGDAHADGCVILREMHLSLETLENRVVSGEVKDVKSVQPLSNAHVEVFFRNNGAPLVLSSDSSGKFQFNLVARVRQISISYLGYRSLIVDFSSNQQLL